ncbi:MAG TPA: hypothetical protein VGW10_06805 [Solirubrobacteraceae bacterium]|nr:hypothetical protein [Solirubrobacteraceae bacterium]
MSRSVRLSLLAVLVVALGGVIGLVLLSGGGAPGDLRAAAAKCEDESAEAGAQKEQPVRSRDGRNGALFSGPVLAEPPCGERPGLPESFADLSRANSQMAARSVAPGTELKPGAQRAAVRAAAELPVTGGDWKPYGRAPLETGRTEYDVSDESTQLGLGNVGGRLNVFAHDPATGRLFTTGSAVGVWTSTDGGDNWSSIGDGLPTQSNNGLAWTAAGGGTLLALTGDGAFGGSAYTGMGAYWTTDLGRTWNRSSGIPDGTVAFKLAVDPNNASTVYAATGAGLFRSTDAGRSYVNVNLPTGEDAPAGSPDCTGKLPSVKGCYLANMVTDVVVQYPDNDKTDGTPGAVMAAVGWRRGTWENVDGTQQAPGNGIYRSDTGEPGTFENVEIEANNVPLAGGDPLNEEQLGRIELGVARGPDQNREYVYAIVQDAVKFNGGAGGLDVSEGAGAPQPTYLNAVWVSRDFGDGLWYELDGANTMSNDPSRESALSVACQAPIVLYCPGVQAWYNLWVEPDPTRADANGVPTRLAFGLEEVWADDQAIDNPLDGSTSMHAKVVGRYYAGNACGILLILNELPACPTQPAGVPDYTTHPDQHGALWLPDGNGGVTLLAANDGGVYKQHREPGEDLSNFDWTHGSNGGMNTLQPYHLAVSENGTVYMGLQDNGEAKIDPDGRTYTVFGGDGFFSAVEPKNPDVAYEEYTNGVMSVTKDGGKNWTTITPTGLTAALFSTAFEMDANDPKHLVTAGRDVRETTAGPDTTSATWSKPFNLGTREKPGDAAATASSSDPNNQSSAIDTKSFRAPGNAPTGPKTPDINYTGGATTAPNPASPDVFVPGTYEDREITLAPDAGNLSMRVFVSWANKDNDWDLFLYRRNADGSLEEVDHSTSSSLSVPGNTPTGTEQVVLPNPPAGEYVVRVANYTATGTYDASITFEQRTSADETITATYVGYCGFCDTITQGTPFKSGIATNVGGSARGKANSSDGWHIAAARGLPERLITSVRMDPTDIRTIYVTLGGYNRRWVAPGAVSEDTSLAGKGHMFKSTDAGETFTDISGDLPDVPANWSALRDNQLIVATDIGVFVSCDSAGGAYSRLGRGLPTSPAMSMQFRPGHPDELFVANFGRAAWTYKFSGPAKRCGTGGAPPAAPTPPGTAPVPPSCSVLRGFDRVRVRNTRRGVRFQVSRKINAPFTIDVFRESRGRRVVTEKRVAHFPRRQRGLLWRASRRMRNGFYFARFIMRSGGASDARRIALRKRGRKFRVRPGFHTGRRCKLIRLARLTRPVFGGTNRKPLRVSARLNTPGSLTFTIRRGKKVVARKRFAAAGTRVRRFTVRDRRAFRRGDYKATVVARAGGVAERVTLTGRRL